MKYNYILALKSNVELFQLVFLCFWRWSTSLENNNVEQKKILVLRMQLLEELKSKDKKWFGKVQNKNKVQKLLKTWLYSMVYMVGVKIECFGAYRSKLF